MQISLFYIELHQGSEENKRSEVRRNEAYYANLLYYLHT